YLPWYLCITSSLVRTLSTSLDYPDRHAGCLHLLLASTVHPSSRQDSSKVLSSSYFPATPPRKPQAFPQPPKPRSIKPDDLLPCMSAKCNRPGEMECLRRLGRVGYHFPRSTLSDHISRSWLV
ncbi:hypothetical protein CLAIMM_11986, partial [Cladophialophora immunda]